MTKGLLILDLDETLIHSEEFPRTKESNRTFDFKVGFENDEYWYMTKKRPYLNEFLEFAFENFDIGIWTASSEDYATIILENIGIDKSKLKFFYTRENCGIRLDYEKGTYYGIKDLKKLKKKGWAKQYTSKIGQVRELSRVLIVDDIEETSINNKSNLILMTPFYFNENDTELLNLISYLKIIKDESNYRTVDKRSWRNKIS